ncbi:MAG: S46 family peptidase [Pseudomonadota bacterium]
MCMVIALPAMAVEGMWTPEQLPDIEADLKRVGLRMDVEALTDLTAFPMGAVVSLGGCTASFVSPGGLVVTNHHCARGSVQFNSSEDANYLRDGFIAADNSKELQAAPGTRVYVTTRVEDVTSAIEAELTEALEPRERYQAIEDKRKELIAECESAGGVRCQVPSFYGGATYKLIERLEIRDVRLVYAPGDNIGRYGGDADNWLWPRHTGDFAFYRAYVGPDGQPADFSTDNIPFQPSHFLKVSQSGLDEGDFVMAAGYPGTTRRYARLSEVENTFSWRYPTYETLLDDWIRTIEEAAPEGTDARIKYESRLAGLNNFKKNLAGQLAGAERVGLTARRAAREAELANWIEQDKSGASFARTFEELDALVEEINRDARSDFWYSYATRPTLLSAAQNLYRLAIEKEKPDEAREPGFQQRDMNFFKQRLQVIDRRFDPVVDKAEWLLFLASYLAQPQEQRVAALDDALHLDGSRDKPETLSGQLDELYSNSKLADAEERLRWMERPIADFEASSDPFIRLAVALYDHEIAEEEQNKAFRGRMAEVRPAYMDAITAYAESKGQAVYPDANSTLRITYGTVFGGSPKDGLIYEPFTRLEGIAEKNTGKPPFDAPERQLALVESEDFGRYSLDSLGSVPVNFLSDLDSTGGNSGSATLDADGNLVGLLFDGTIESVNSDWNFDPRTTRAIHVDTRYMLWVMEKIDNAGHLIDEMTVTTTGSR